MLRCLAKAPAGRPQSYAELADLLRPYGSADEVPAPLGARFIAWIADSVIVSIAIWLLMSSAWMVGVTLGSATTLLRLSAWSWLAPVIYYLVLEGGWGASLGKRLMGLRVTSQTDDRWWLRVGLRTAVFHVPAAFHSVLHGGGRSGRRYTANLRRADGLELPPDALLSLLLTILLFSTARRGNGWTGVHERAEPVRVSCSGTSSGPSYPPLRRCHLPISFLPFRPCDASDRTPCTRWSARPAADDCSSGSIRSFAVMSGFTKFRQGHRRSTPTRRDVSRPGRLYWLAGRRSATENWDAFEAPRGEPFLTAPPTSDWRQVHRALSSLATELDASAHEDRDTRLSLAHVWRRADGQLVLLDFSWPAPVAPDANQTLNPVELLAAVSTRAFAPTTEPAAPLSATTAVESTGERSAASAR